MLSKTDEQLIALIRGGNPDAEAVLLERYKDIVRRRAQIFRITGADGDDIIQEGMIGLFKAILKYKPKANASFRIFAETCIRRQIYTAIKRASRQKHLPLNTAFSLYEPLLEEESCLQLIDLVNNPMVSNPEEHFLKEELSRDFQKSLFPVLSDFEKKVLLCYLDRQSYQDIASELSSSTKGIDNALTRIKKKLSRVWKERHLEIEDIADFSGYRGYRNP